MANLVELSNQLEDFPEQQLVQMSQDPNSMYPSYLVLSEIQRRNQMRKMYEAQQPKPQTTVAEEVIGEFTGQQGLQGAMAQSPGPQDAFPPSDMGNMAPPSPMQAMASGGRTGYQVGGFTPTAENPYPTGSELVSDTFTPTGTIEERALIAAGINPQGMKLEDIKNTYNLLKQDYREKNPGLGAKAFEFMYGEEFGDEFMDYVSSVPIGGLAVKGLQKGLPMIPKAYKGLKNYFRGPKKNPSGKVTSAEAYGGEGYKYIKPIVENPITSSIVATPILGGINQLTGEPKIEPNINNEDTTKSTEQLEIDRLNALLAEMRNKDSETVDTSKDRRNADMLIGLGGAIGSAKNLGELSSNISDAYFGVQSKRDAKDLAGLQGRLIEAQASKYEADVANMGPKDIINEQNSISAFLKQANEGAIQLTEQQKNELAQRYFDLQKQLDTLRSQTGTGFAVSESPTGGDMDIFKKTKIPA